MVWISEICPANLHIQFNIETIINAELFFMLNSPDLH